MIYIFSFLFLIALGWFVFHHFAKRQLIKQIEQLVDLTKMGLAVRLVTKYKRRYDQDFAVALAAAVANEVFLDSPTTDKACHFLKEQGDLVAQETRALSQDRYICNVLTQVVRAKSIRAFAKGVQANDTLFAPIENLQHYDILIPGGNAPSLKTLTPLVKEFYKGSLEEEEQKRR